MIKVVTHSGKFHADDVFSFAALSLLFGENNIELIRTRDPEIIKTGDIVFDVGQLYDIPAKRFDHHQGGGAGKRENGLPYAAFGLVWKEYGNEICKDGDLQERIDQRLVQLIDAEDNGVTLSTANFPDVEEYTIDNVVDVFMPTWQEGEADIDKCFLEASRIAKRILERLIQVVGDKIKGEEIVRGIYEQSEDKRIIFLKQPYLGKDILINYPEPLFVIYPYGENRWAIEAVKAKKGTFINRKDFPKEWAGKSSDELRALTDVPDALFCHNALFFASAESSEGALAMAKIALENKS